MTNEQVDEHETYKDFYVLEYRNDVCYGQEVRFRSLFNSCMGPWRQKIGDAMEDGIKHAKLVLRFHCAS